MRGFRHCFLVCILSFFLPLVAPQAHAQQQIAHGAPAVALNGPWKFRIGDSPKVGASQTPLWAQLDYDDSAWQDYTIDPKHSQLTAVQAIQSTELPGWQQHGHPGYTGYAWYRIRLQIAPSAHSLALLMPQYFDDVYQVYFDGRKIGTFGKLDGRPVIYVYRPVVFPIPDVLLRGSAPATLAIRFWKGNFLESPDQNNSAGGLRGIPIVGPAALLGIFRQNLRQQQFNFQLANRWYAGLYGAVGLISLFLFLFSRNRREYLWAGLVLLSMAAFFIAGTVEINFRIPVEFVLALPYLGFWIGLSAVSLAMMYLLGVPKAFWRRCNQVASTCLGIGIGTDIVIVAGKLPAGGVWTRFAGILVNISVAAFCLLLLGIVIDGVRTHGRKAWLSLSPALFLLGIPATGIVQLFLPRLPYLGAVQVGLWCSFPLAILGVFLMRFTRQERENAVMAGELEAARSMQSLLVPAAPPHAPGFSIESVYIPSSQVGGDFFHISPGDDGSLLIVVGDVSGKGLKAAMTVSTIVGALRNESSREPAQVLESLNRVLHGQIKGFVTCCAMLISAQGEMAIANAGHIPPYRNGEEMAVPSALPLGIVGDSMYEEAPFQLAPGDRLTFVSDGVVEATNEKRELFGFARTQQISNRPAPEIAAAAQAFGQEDDITVVRVQFNGAEAICPRPQLEIDLSAAPAG